MRLRQLVIRWLNGSLDASRAGQAAALEEPRSRAERETAARLAVAEERARIARELHDILAHSVSVMVLQASAVRRRLAPEQESERSALLSVERAGREALTEMRRLVGAVRTEDEQPELAPQPRLDDLGKLVRQTREAGLPVDVRIEGTPVSLPPGIDLSAYRVVQEGLANALRHAGPARAEVVVRYGTGAVEVQVLDDGCGPTGGNGRAGHGISGLQERIRLYGGKLEAGSRVEGGYQLRARLPVTASACGPVHSGDGTDGTATTTRAA
jgi:signal transduction histidine kinase